MRWLPVLILAVFVSLLVAWAWYDREWLDYRLRGCRCGGSAVIMEDAQGNLHITPACQGHPTYPRALPGWLIRWLDTSYPLPPPVLERPNEPTRV